MPYTRASKPSTAAATRAARRCARPRPSPSVSGSRVAIISVRSPSAWAMPLVSTPLVPTPLTWCHGLVLGTEQHAVAHLDGAHVLPDPVDLSPRQPPGHFRRR